MYKYRVGEPNNLHSPLWYHYTIATSTIWSPNKLISNMYSNFASHDATPRQFSEDNSETSVSLPSVLHIPKHTHFLIVIIKRAAFLALYLFSSLIKFLNSFRWKFQLSISVAYLSCELYELELMCILSRCYHAYVTKAHASIASTENKLAVRFVTNARMMF